MEELRARLFSQPSRFLLVGGWNTVFGFLSFAGLWHVTRPLALHYSLVLAIATVLAVTNAFACYRLFVFRSSSPLLHDYLRFWASYAFLIGLQFAALSLCVSGLGLQPVLSQALVLAASLVVSYFAHQRFTFRQPPAPQKREHP
jgi:putative flippase GtrA